ncbi:MAG: transposase [Burkholderiales bacterium]
MRYRRATLAGATYFFTVNLAERRGDHLTRHIDLLRDVIHRVKIAHLFHIDAMVVLPDHIHAIWTMPDYDTDYPMRWSLIKAGISRRLGKTERINESRQSKRERGIWQRRYWEHLIRNEHDYAAHFDYIHINPVKHGYVIRAVAWPHSSIHQYVERGMVAADWGLSPMMLGTLAKLRYAECWASYFSPTYSG